MLDPQLLRNQIDEVVNGLARRGVELDVGAFRELEGERKRLQVQTEALRGRRNTESKAIGKAKCRRFLCPIHAGNGILEAWSIR